MTELLVLVRDVTTDECPWLREGLLTGEVVTRFDKATYGCIGNGGVAVSRDGEYPFFELPRNSVEEVSEVPSSGTTTLPAPKSSPQPVISPQQEGLDTGAAIDGEPWTDGWQPPAPRTELIWAAIDLDGTLSEGVWTPGSSGREIGRPIERNIHKLSQLVRAGYKIVIHTARGWEHYEAIESWLDHYGLPYDRIVCGKLLAAVYVDDRAVESEELDWTPQAQNLRQRLRLANQRW